MATGDKLVNLEDLKTVRDSLVTNEIGDLKKAIDYQLEEYNVPVAFDISLNTASSIFATTGGNGGIGCRTGYISFDRPFVIDFSLEGFVYTAWCYRSNDAGQKVYSPSMEKFITGVCFVKTVSASNPKFRIGFKKTDGTAMTSEDTESILAALKFKGITDKTLSIPNAAADAKTVGDAISELDGSVWNGKTWYCYGTSMSDTEIAHTGKYPQVVESLSGMTMHNYGIGSGGICPSLSHQGNVKTAIMNCPWDVDLVTFEVGLNDIGNIDLGEIGDESNDTYIGNFTQCLKKLTMGTRAKVVFIVMPGRTFTDASQTYRQNPHRVFRSANVTKPYSYRDAVDLEIELCKLYGVEVIDLWSSIPLGWRNKVTITDHTHNTDAGGLLYGTYIWKQLKNMMPCNVTFTQEDIGEVW